MSRTLRAEEERAWRARRAADRERALVPLSDAPGKKPNEVFVCGAEGGARSEEEVERVLDESETVGG